MRSSILPTTLFIIGFMAVSAQATLADSAPGQAVACSDLTALNLAQTTIALAETVPAGAFEQPPDGFSPFAADYSRLPAFCRVAGSIKPSADSDIRFELWLPATHWNGKFLQTGNGGAAGSVFYFGMAEPLTRGYAVANTDTGHRGGGGDFGWVPGHPEQLIDFQWRAVHELTRVGKTITTAHYGRAPAKSYFNGCSTGGRQGLLEAQRFPDDYDAIIAGAPANNWVLLLSLSAMIEGSLGPGKLPVEQLGMLKEAAIAACDTKDGLQDRIIDEPEKCDFDPGSLQCKDGQTTNCLSGQAVAAARRIYAGLVSKDGEVLFPGTGPASEPTWVAYTMPGFRIGSNYYRNVVMNDPAWDPATFDVDRDLPRAEQADAGATSAMDPDLSSFIARGGKLILYHGTTDGLIPYRNTVNYYRSVVARMGADKLKGSIRFYLVPGMDHCAGGEGAWAIDYLTPLESWVEQGEAPAALPGAHPLLPFGQANAPPGQAFTRPVCPYPQIPAYQGSGDTADAANFECVSP